MYYKELERKKKIEDQKQKKLLEELKDCTFQPNKGRTIKSITPSNQNKKNRFEFLFQESKFKKSKQKEEID